MGIADLLTLDRVVSDARVSSKKRALELLSGLLADIEPALSESEIFDGLVARERLGSTGLGHGIAIPHGRFKHLTGAYGAVIKLAEPVDFDAVDGEPVGLVFALVVPEESTDEHLQLLSALAEMFRDETVRQRLFQTASADELIEIFQNRGLSG